jgi:uncharacterized protein YbjT (DUF2867 family)
VGAELVELLLREPRVERVTTLVRHASGRTHEKLTERVIDFERLEEELADGHASHVFCCLGTTLSKAGSREAFRKVDHDYPVALGRAARSAGAEAFLVVTATGANRDSVFFYNRVKGEVENSLAALALERLHVFRPSLLLGDRAERRPGEQLAIAVSGPLGKVLVGPLKKLRPIRAVVVARAMLSVALQPTLATQKQITLHESDAIAKLGAVEHPAKGI